MSFLDLSGLEKLWQKIVGGFLQKTDTLTDEQIESATTGGGNDSQSLVGGMTVKDYIDTKLENIEADTISANEISVTSGNSLILGGDSYDDETEEDDWFEIKCPKRPYFNINGNIYNLPWKDSGSQLDVDLLSRDDASEQFKISPDIRVMGVLCQNYSPVLSNSEEYKYVLMKWGRNRNRKIRWKVPFFNSQLREEDSHTAWEIYPGTTLLFGQGNIKDFHGNSDPNYIEAQNNISSYMSEQPTIISPASKHHSFARFGVAIFKRVYEDHSGKYKWRRVSNIAGFRRYTNGNLGTEPSSF